MRRLHIFYVFTCSFFVLLCLSWGRKGDSVEEVLLSSCARQKDLASEKSTAKLSDFENGDNKFNSGKSLQKRVAYVVSMNTSTTRFRQTEEVLFDFGFEVTSVKPYYFGTSREKQTLSNKIALLTAATLISRGEEPWGYVFEDDIYKHELSQDNLATVIKSERESTLFHYLGICTEGKALKKPVRNMCGRCAHAMGLSKRGALELLEFANLRAPKLEVDQKNAPGDEVYLDVIIQGWCEKSQPPGFRVVGPLTASAKGTDGHYGIFLQDRKNFESEIDKAPISS